MDIYPSIVRTNMRNRGPIESNKLNRNNLDLLYNMKYLCAQMNQSESDLNELAEVLYDRSNIVSARLININTYNGGENNV